jgi:hypothetical protein
VRTTVELPLDLFRAAKSRSAENGESLKSLLTRAVAAELQTDQRSGPRGRVTLPLFGSASGRPVRLTNADLERALVETEVMAVPARRTPRRHRRPSR